MKKGMTQIRNIADRMRGETKAEVLEGDNDFHRLVAFSVYDSKPVHFLSMAANKLAWERNERPVYDKTKGKVVNMPFYRTSVQNFYNHYMNSVDTADQLRGSYNFQHWMRNRKWWWALFMWGFGVLLVNAYILYNTEHLYIWLKKKENILSQYDFRKEVVLTWMNIDTTTCDERNVPVSGDRKRSAPFSVSKDSITTRSSNQQKTRKKGRLHELMIRH